MRNLRREAQPAILVSFQRIHEHFWKKEFTLAKQTLSAEVFE